MDKLKFLADFVEAAKDQPPPAAGFSERLFRSTCMEMLPELITFWNLYLP